jgi:hypothetical protein
VSDQLHAPAALPRGKSPQYPLVRRLGGPRAGLDDLEKRKVLTLPGLELQPLGRPARSQSLYRPRSSPHEMQADCKIIEQLYEQRWKSLLVSIQFSVLVKTAYIMFIVVSLVIFTHTFSVAYLFCLYLNIEQRFTLYNSSSIQRGHRETEKISAS